MSELKRFTIAQIAPLIEPIPPLTYGGTERVTAALTRRLVINGHEVILFASGDSDPNLPTRLFPGYPTSLREARETGLVDFNIYEPNSVTRSHIKKAYALADQLDVDIIHSQYGTEDLADAVRASKKRPVVKTIHGLLTPTELEKYQRSPGPRIVSISKDQMKDDKGDPWTKIYARINYAGCVYNGLDLEDAKFNNNPGEYLVAGGRISLVKGIDSALDLSEIADMPIKVFGKVDADTGDKEYYETQIKHRIDHKRVEFVGELNQQERDELISGALAYVHLARWREPFGLTLIEAQANGCPVIGINLGAVPEIIKHRRTGFVVNDLEEALSALKDIEKIDRAACRARAQNKFSDKAMARGYQNLYSETLAVAA
jgi:glycosyltransferase involved in cell wall biosynthesis